MEEQREKGGNAEKSKVVRNINDDEIEFEIKGDPTNGLLEKATSLLFVPCASVSLDSLVSVEAAFGKYSSEISNTKLNNEAR